MVNHLFLHSGLSYYFWCLFLTQCGVVFPGVPWDLCLVCLGCGGCVLSLGAVWFFGVLFCPLFMVILSREEWQIF